MIYDTFFKRLIQEKYKDYILQHQENVLSGYKWILENLPDVVLERDKPVIWNNLTHHDLSKYSEDEFDAYAEHFYGRTQGKEDDVDFDYAWLHHIHHNPHHWQYWVIPAHDEKEFKILDMPYPTIIEMICDWWSFSFKIDK